MNGMRPVAEMQLSAFASTALRAGGLPTWPRCADRTRAGEHAPGHPHPLRRRRGRCERRCDSSESYYAHTPAERSFTPASVTDAYVMLREAIDSRTPWCCSSPSGSTGPPRRWTWTSCASGTNGNLPKREGHAVVARRGIRRDPDLLGPSVPVCLAAAEEPRRTGCPWRSSTSAP
ncbi:hypothetical protein QJS66_12295 [Kocuria rhizophila]|nr:hypothetical protein QJS66_12295 [Kocuria rhizophila]